MHLAKMLREIYFNIQFLSNDFKKIIVNTIFVSWNILNKISKSYQKPPFRLGRLMQS